MSPLHSDDTHLPFSRILFRSHEPVSRRLYATVGFGLMGLKYAVDAALVYGQLGTWWTPLDYLSPLLATRERLTGDAAGPWLLPAMLLWTLPFLWIGASMTMRRAVDAGFRPSTTLLFFAPVLNYLFMLALCVVPSRPPQEMGPPDRVADSRPGDLFRAAWPAALLGAVLTAISVFLVESYGAMLFVGTPVAIGFLAGMRAPDNAVSAAALAVLLTGGALLLFALEGVICLVMAAPLAVILAGIGGLLGESVGRQHELNHGQMGALLAFVPLLMAAERSVLEPPLREVVSSVEIDAPASAVWEHVIGFSQLPPPRRWVFTLGIAHPVRARIEGEGVGAVRYCEFSTGPFVEPITVWEPPRRLGFDVAAQPAPMHETSPYQVVHAPHLLDGLRSERGEFRLVPLSDSRTRLEGSTWYRLDMAPAPYWSLISDRLIHAIHQRVLEHVKNESEQSAERA